MLENIRMKLENGGIEVIEAPFDFHYKTTTFIKLPDGRQLAYYDYMHQIPETLYNGEEISIGESAIPTNAKPMVCDESGENSSNGWIWDGDNPQMGNRSLPIPAGVIALIIFLVKLIAVFIVVYVLLQKWLHPCGPHPYTEEVDQCLKVITYPDCSTITVNSCNKDEQGNYDPEIVNETGAPGQDLAKLLLYGVLAVGGIVVLLQVLKWSERKQYYGYHPEEMPPPKPSVLERGYGAVARRIK